MPATDTSEKGLETLIFQAMTGRTGLEPVPDTLQEVSPTAAGGTGWLAGGQRDYDRTHALATAQLFAFLQATQPEDLSKLGIANFSNKSDIALLKFLARLESEIGKRGVIDVLRNGIRHGALSFELFYGTPSPGNAKAAALHAASRFSVTRQLRYSTDETRRALDLVIFINGLPIATFELKNSLTKQTVEDAVEQYRRDRDPREKLFELGRCVVHFALDENEVMFCTQLKGKASWFLPFNQGWNDGAANPPNSDGLKTLEMFGEPLPPDAEGKVKHKPFHSYTMKQVIQEGFILDVLKSYTPVDSYYKLVKKIESDPEFDTKKAKKKLRKYVESHDHAIRLKAEIMVDHFGALF